MNSTSKVKKLTGIALITALEIILNYISGFITIGQVNINLALIPIIVGACMYGPSAGAFIGAINGVMTCFAPSTLALFMPHNPIATVILCILKTGAAGFAAGLIYKLISRDGRHELTGTIAASAAVPIINTGIYILGVYAFFLPIYEQWNENGINIFMFVILSVLTVNFVIELAVSLILSPAVQRIIRAASSKFGTRTYK